MSDPNNKWYRDPKLLKLQEEWYRKLKDDGFYDIEGGVEGHMLTGPTTSISLHSLANKNDIDHGLKRDRAPRAFDDVADSLNDDINFMDGGKARYFHHAALVACQAIREGTIPDVRCWAWALHAQGLGERQIADLLELTRSQIRKHIAVLRTNIKLRMDHEFR